MAVKCLLIMEETIERAGIALAAISSILMKQFTPHCHQGSQSS